MRITGVLSALAITLTAACASVPRQRAAARYDVLITNARVVDGTGNPWYRGSVATIGDRIAYVGPSIPGLSARRVIDAHDQVVRSEERRVGKECRWRWAREQSTKKYGETIG